MKLLYTTTICVLLFGVPFTCWANCQNHSSFSVTSDALASTVLAKQHAYALAYKRIAVESGRAEVSNTISYFADDSNQKGSQVTTVYSHGIASLEVLSENVEKSGEEWVHNLTAKCRSVD